MGSITTFADLLTVRGRRHEISWESLFDRLEKPNEVAAKQVLPLWLPGTLVDDDRSAERAQVEQIGALVLDFDKAAPVEHAVHVFGDFYGFVHTSFSHTEALPCYRAILPFDHAVTGAEYPAIWRAAEAMCLAGGLTPDPSCKNATRCWFAPGRRPDGPFEARHLEGGLLVPDELAAGWSKPEEVRNDRAWLNRRDYPYGCPDERARRIRRAEAYVERMPPSISGERGDDALWRVALAVVRGFDLDEGDALPILRVYNDRRARPRWAESRLRYKIRHAAICSNLPRGYLLDRGAA